MITNKIKRIKKASCPSKIQYSSTPPLHYSKRLTHQGKTHKALSGGSSKPGHPGLDSLFLPESVREPVDLVAKPSNHEKVI
jgi:hypothetical protein